jgi:hypothetical protein
VFTAAAADDEDFHARGALTRIIHAAPLFAAAMEHRRSPPRSSLFARTARAALAVRDGLPGLAPFVKHSG